MSLNMLLLLASVSLVLVTSSCAFAIDVAVYAGGGAMEEFVAATIDAVTANTNDMTAAPIQQEDIVSGKLNDFDVLILPAGSGNGQADSLGIDGCHAIEKYVAAGNGFVSICAGSYLAVKGWKESTSHLELLNAELWDLDNWARGEEFIEIEFAERAAEQSPQPPLSRASKDQPLAKVTVPSKEMAARRKTIWFENGPIFSPAADPYLPEYLSLARYVTDLHNEDQPAGMMAGKDAIIASTYGKGRVIAFGPHPEKTDGLGTLLTDAIRWVADKAETENVVSWESVFVTELKNE